MPVALCESCTEHYMKRCKYTVQFYTKCIISRVRSVQFMDALQVVSGMGWSLVGVDIQRGITLHTINL